MDHCQPLDHPVHSIRQGLADLARVHPKRTGRRGRFHLEHDPMTKNAEIGAQGWGTSEPPTDKK